MLRVVLIRLSAGEHILVGMAHHIAFDGWSIAIVVDELTELYRSKKENREAVLKVLPIQYADYALWQREHLSGELLERGLDYWKEKLRGTEPLSLPADYKRLAGGGIEGGVCHGTTGA